MGLKEILEEFQRQSPKPYCKVTEPSNKEDARPQRSGRHRARHAPADALGGSAGVDCICISLPARCFHGHVNLHIRADNFAVASVPPSVAGNECPQGSSRALGHGGGNGSNCPGTGAAHNGSQSLACFARRRCALRQVFARWRQASALIDELLSRTQANKQRNDAIVKGVTESNAFTAIDKSRAKPGPAAKNCAFDNCDGIGASTRPSAKDLKSAQPKPPLSTKEAMARLDALLESMDRESQSGRMEATKRAEQIQRVKQLRLQLQQLRDGAATKDYEALNSIIRERQLAEQRVSERSSGGLAATETAVPPPITPPPITPPPITPPPITPPSTPPAIAATEAAVPPPITPPPITPPSTPPPITPPLTPPSEVAPTTNSPDLDQRAPASRASTEGAAARLATDAEASTKMPAEAKASEEAAVRAAAKAKAAQEAATKSAQEAAAVAAAEAKAAQEAAAKAVAEAKAAEQAAAQKAADEAAAKATADARAAEKAAKQEGRGGGGCGKERSEGSIGDPDPRLEGKIDPLFAAVSMTPAYNVPKLDAPKPASQTQIAAPVDTRAPPPVPPPAPLANPDAMALKAAKEEQLRALKAKLEEKKKQAAMKDEQQQRVLEERAAKEEELRRLKQKAAQEAELRKQRQTATRDEELRRVRAQIEELERLTQIQQVQQ